MAGNKFDKSRVTTALEVVKEHPGMALVLATPILLVFVALWWFVHPAIAVVALMGVFGGGIYAISKGPAT